MSQLNLTGSQEQIDEKDVLKDQALRALLRKPPAEIEQWVDTNVTDLQSAKNVLSKLAKAVAVIARKQFPGYRP